MAYILLFMLSQRIMAKVFAFIIVMVFVTVFIFMCIQSKHLDKIEAPVTNHCDSTIVVLQKQLESEKLMAAKRELLLAEQIVNNEKQIQYLQSSLQDLIQAIHKSTSTRERVKIDTTYGR